MSAIEVMQQQQEIKLPHNAEFERLVLGSVLLDQTPEHFFDVAEKLRSTDFFVGSNRMIFEAFTTLAMRGDDLAYPTLVDELRRTLNLEQVGGPAYIGSLTEGVPRRLRLDTEIRRIRDLSAKRWLMKLGHQIVLRAEADEEPAENLLESTERMIVEARSGQVEDDTIDSPTAVDRALKSIAARWDKSADEPGVKTGFGHLDRILHGLRPGRLHLLAARPGEGKTCLALNIAHNSSQMRVQSPPVILVVSLEMPTDELIDRAIATVTQIDADRLLEGDLTERERQDVYAAADQIRQLDVHYLDPSAQLLVDGIRARARRLKQRRGRLDLIILDFIQLVSSSRQDHSEYARLTEISRGLKLLALSENVPILAISQMSREIEKRHGKSEPQLSDLRGSGSLEQDADVVMFLHNPHESDDAIERQLLIKKQRGGRTGIVNLLWHKSQSRFTTPYQGTL